MHRFEIWAPFAKRLAVSVNGKIHLMDGLDPHGYWRAHAADANFGADYGFLIDEDPTLYPDPRSQQQPNGVHGASRLYDQTAFAWTDARFQAPPLASGVIYELHIGTFTSEGTFDAAIDKLDYLVNLGVTHVELMPVAAYEGQHGWGYDGVALFAVHEPYGGPSGLKRFVNAAHEKGLAVLLDVVYNHFGPSGNYTGKFGPYVVDSHHTPWGGAVNLEDAGSREVRRFFCDNALMWLRDFHIDGLRIDAVHAFVDRSAIHFLEQLAAEVETLETALARRLVLIGEIDLNDPRVVTPRAASGALASMRNGAGRFSSRALHCALHDGKSGGYNPTLAQSRSPKRSLKLLFTTATTPAFAIVYMAGRRGPCRSIVFWVTSRITIRWAIARRATESFRLAESTARRSPQR